MSSRKRCVIYFLIIIAIFVNACRFGAISQPSDAGQSVQQPAAINPEPTHTKFVFPTLLPTNTSIPQPAAQVCNSDAALDMIEKLIPYAEYEVYFFTEDGNTNLIVWFVDHELNLSTTEEAFSQNVVIAQNHAVMLVQQLNFAEECMDDLFDEIGITVSDQYYNVWFNGKIHTALLPDDIQTNPDQISLLKNQFEVTYLRNEFVEILADPPTDSCSWKQAHHNIVSHMDPADKNTAFFYESSSMGRTIVAQWEGTFSDMASDSYLTTLEYIGEEAKCLYPQPDLILYYLVDENAIAIGGGLWYLWDPKNPDLDYNSPYLLE